MIEDVKIENSCLNCKYFTSFKDDYIALIGFDASKTTPNPKSYSDFYRTGEVAYLKSNVFEDIFTVELPKR